jgi:GNAT superfamily N-acetyltransferase
MTYRIGIAAAHPGLYRSRIYQEGRWADARLWPAFIAQSETARHAAKIDALFPSFQLAAITESEDEIAGIAHAVPVMLTEDAPLPDSGWEWAVRTSIEMHEQGTVPNTLCGLSVTVARNHQRQGIAASLLIGLRDAALSARFSRFVVPVRPLTAIPWEQVVNFRRPDGAHLDPWIRTHERLGARIVGICPRSMKITAPLTQWSEWGATFDLHERTGSIPGGLVPLHVTGSIATYVEPNVWMQYDLGEIR